VNIPHIGLKLSLNYFKDTANQYLKDQTSSGGFRRAEKHFTVSEAKKYLGDVDSWRIRILK
jgi:hypothetical protein